MKYLNVIFLVAALMMVGTEIRSAALGARPDYRLEGQAHANSPLDAGSPGWDKRGNGCVRDGDRITVLRVGGGSENTDFVGAATAAINRDLFSSDIKWDGAWDRSMMVDTGVQFDAAGHAYTLIIPRYSNLNNAVLLTSSDLCHSWHAVRLAGRNATLEKPQFFTDRSGPPTIVSYEYYGSRRGTRLWLERFVAKSKGLVPADGFPRLVAANSRLSSNHSGGGNSTLTMRGRIVVVYPVIDSSASGTLTMAREYDRTHDKWIGPATPIARSSSAANSDAHDLPAIAYLPKGRVVVVIGAHHAQFRMYTSKTDTIAGGWDGPEIVGDPRKGKAYQQYSYASLDVSSKGTINIIARAEGDRGRYELVQLRKRSDGSWIGWPEATPHRVLAMPNRPQYVAWRQRVTQDVVGNLYLHFAFFPNMLTEGEASALHLSKNDGTRCEGARCWFDNAPSLKQITLVSYDEGATWH
jgi:hypothetical protein